MADPAAQREWITRVLGFAFGAGSGERGSAPALLPLWVAAKDAADADIDKLQRALRQDGDEYLRDIAEFGLNGATERRSVGLMVALREVDATPSAETRAKAADAVDSFRDFLAGAPIIELIEDNPFGVAVPMRATLGGALDEISRALGG